jgi:hypothetical protein
VDETSATPTLVRRMTHLAVAVERCVRAEAACAPAQSLVASAGAQSAKLVGIAQQEGSAGGAAVPNPAPQGSPGGTAPGSFPDGNAGGAPIGPHLGGAGGAAVEES